ncbi:Rne/Rng family ribonuclease [Octadecabacter sp. CECT 8868]|uniref:Rne/Rng family ribonuclease n=1 Tax=Octadecabacter algicola TaxID=2909342 RepID=UPI001F1E1F9A|nr:Rne/Rng family ribonuclease [Octadecabacter algicola]MCF2903688.1 Rne/Rng family ribonuclease [Octadecabacter algicola]
MAKKMLIDATHAEETRVVVVDGNKVEEFDFETQSRRQLAGNIYLAKVTRVEPSLQAAFVDYGGNRHGFLAFNEIHPDYYQIPVADREALMAEEKAYAEAMKAEAEAEAEKPKRSRRRRKPKAAEVETETQDAVATAEPADAEPALAEEDVVSGDIAGMETIDMDPEEGSSPMETVAETPVEEPTDDDDSDDDDDTGPDATAKDDSIESVADEDERADVRPVRKPRPKRYKIQEVIKVRQILLIQVVKEERGNKGAALTTYLSLAGRYCVLMPNTARGGGISRKITNAADRKKLKAIANEMSVPEGAGLIIRTAGSQRTKTEIKRDYEYLQRLWEQIRELTLKSSAPAQIYEEGNLIKRSIRDLYSKEIDEVIVEGEAGYRTAKDFMKMIMPSHAKNVKHYQEQMPLYARHQVESYLSGMFNPTVQLPSGGYIVIGITEALVAIDVNSGRATKEGSIEQTATKTNLEAAAEVARQLRLRDLAGLIVIDFIDMDERKNNAAVEKMMKDKLKTDRARIQVGRISGFGLMEMSRQRLRPGMLESTTQECPHCHGTGLLRSDDNVALGILRQLEEEGVRGRSKEVLVKAPIAIANYLMNQKREHIAQIEARYGLSVRIECDPHLVSPDFALEKFKTATRVVEVTAPAVISSEMAVLADVDEADEDAEGQETKETESTFDGDSEQPTKRRRRRRRRRRGGAGNAENAEANGENTANGEDAVAADAVAAEAAPEGEVTEAAPATEDAPKPKRKRTRRKKTDDDAPKEAVAAEEGAEAPAEAAPEAEAPADAPAEKPKRTRTRRKKVAETPAEDATPAEAEAKADVPAEEKAPAEKPKRTRARKKPAAAAAVDSDAVADKAEVSDAPKEAEAPKEVGEAPAEKPEPVAAEKPKRRRKTTSKVAPDPVPAPEEAAAEDDKPKKRGWWSLGGR